MENQNSNTFSYNQALENIAKSIRDYKHKILKDKCMLVSIEGASNSGKSTISSRLEKELVANSHPALSIEGDMFHVGRSKGIEVYHKIIEDMKKGGYMPENFPDLIWRSEDIKNQILEQIKIFNASSSLSSKLTLNNLLRDKYDGTEHTKDYDISRETIILVSAIYLRHIGDFDFNLYLSLSPEVGIQRKIERCIRIGDKRDPQVTRDMVNLIENPAMIAHNRKYPIKRGIIANMDSFENVNLEFIHDN